MQKRKILVVCTSGMHLGGIETSLIGLLDAIDYSKYDVDLFLFSHKGELFSQIPSSVRILPRVKSCDMIREPILDCVKTGCIGLAFMRILIKAYCCLSGKTIRMMDMYFRWLNPFLPTLDERYDIALGFFGPHDYLVKHVNADGKVGWLHTDYSKVEYDLAYNAKTWEALDYIAGVSEECSHIFSELLPGIKGKVVTIENILSKEFVKKRADAFDVVSEMPDNTIRLLTVGRFSHPKRMDEIPEMCRLLLQDGLNVKWYLIGYGPDETLIRQKICDAGMQERVILLGKKINPYPYIKACDVYIQPSRYEGKCVAVREAQLLGKPVIITDYPTARSQLENGVDGIIVPMELNACARSIGSALQNQPLLDRLSVNCTVGDYTNSRETEKIYTLMEK